MIFQLARSAFTYAVAAVIACAHASRAEDPVPDWKALGLFPSMQDRHLGDALYALMSVTDMSNEGPRRRLPAENIYASPRIRRHLEIALATADSPDFASLDTRSRGSIARAVTLAVASGIDEFIPVLKRLAHSKDPDLYEATASWGLDARPFPALDLMCECVLAAEERLPLSLDNLNDPEDRQAAQRAFDEFVARLGHYCDVASPEEREAMRPVVERFLAKYENPAVKEFYEAKLLRYLRQGTAVNLDEAESAAKTRDQKAQSRVTPKATPNPVLPTNQDKGAIGTSSQPPSVRPWLLGGAAAALAAWIYWFMRRKSG